MKVKIVVLDDAPAVLKPHLQFQRLGKVGVVEVFDSLPKSAAEILRRADGCHTLILLRHHISFSAELLSALSRHLQHLAIWGTGVDHVDVESAIQTGIAVSHTPGTSSLSVAEHCISLAMAAMRSINWLDARLRAGQWSPAELMQLKGKTMGVIGTGRIGRRVTQMAIALGMKVVAFDAKPDYGVAEATGFEYRSMDDVLSLADVLTLHVPANEKTFHLISDRELAHMKPSAILINTARGSLVDEKALVAALESGRLRSAGLDVFEQEPIPSDHPLLSMANTVLTPHVADKTPEAVDAGMELLVDNVVGFIQHGSPVVKAGRTA